MADNENQKQDKNKKGGKSSMEGGDRGTDNDTDMDMSD
jgi:hypothetical protein